MRNPFGAKSRLIWARIILVAALSLMLAGCFDIAVRLTIKDGGSGKINFRITYSREFSGMIAAGQAGKPPPPAFDQRNAGVSRRDYMENGQLVHEETIEFQKLSDLVMNDHIEISVLGTTLMGATRNRVTWSLPTGAGGQNPRDAQAAAAFFANHNFQIAMDLPCWVESATDADIGGLRVAAATGLSTASWTIPVTALLATPGSNRMVLSVDCWSWAGIKASATRAPGASAQAPAPPPPPVTQPAATPSQTPTAPPSSTPLHDTVLTDFPLLSQKDPANYAPQSALYTAADFVDSKINPDAKAPIPMLACAATVYLMIERGFGRSNAYIDDIYVPGKGKGAMPSQLLRASISAKEPIDTAKIAASIAQGLPVTMRGEGGPLANHYVLVVGVATVEGRVTELIANDPYPGAGVQGPGRRIRLAVGPTIYNPELGIVFKEMRLVTRKSGEGAAWGPLRIDGIGPITVGMTSSDSLAAGVRLNVDRGDPACTYAALVPPIPGLSFMLNDGRIVRIDVGSTSAIKTTFGMGVGNTEQQVLDAAAAAGLQTEVTLHKYVMNAHYIIVRSARTAATHAFVFETDGQRVTMFRAGFAPQVHWVEGCL